MTTTTLTTFADLGASTAVIDALAAQGITQPFDIQRLVLADALAGHDVLAKSRTGSGKTLAFAIPIVERTVATDGPPTALILVPTRELAAQVADEFAGIARAKRLRVATAYGGVGLGEQGRRAARADILIATPGRLIDLASRQAVKLGHVAILVLDEADRMLDMGFQPQVDRIVARIPSDRQTMFFSATLDGAVGHLAGSYTRAARLHEVAAPIETVDEVDHRFVPVAPQHKIGALVELLTAERSHALVFVRTKRGADRLTERLRAHGVRAVAMHGDMSQAARERSLERFDSGKADTLVATDVAARGLDLDRITHVVNFDPPSDDKGYVHRVGRTARAGRSGTGVTFVLPDQQGDVGRMASRLKLHEDFEREGLTTPPSRAVYTAPRRRNSLLGKRRRPRF
ncbi:MAG: DEAD/DEAH box helicase [Acidobacteria bacterium]|nr:DEAD/DEAH box helicase [Acidobacteriota bacterium]